MPTYDYKCKKCGELYLDQTVPIANRLDPTKFECTTCDEKAIVLMIGKPGMGDSVRLGIKRPQSDVIDKKNLKYGIGFDVHRLVPKRKLYLGGIKIQSNLGTLGHSDGDAVLHAITDSILGACKMRDIGQKFSNKNKKYKNIRSTILLRKIIDQIKLKNYAINNIDINIITQKPKISKFKNKMIQSISKICEISTNQINIKGKTTEKLGLIGKEKAIACEVITSVIKYA